eukprot:jgi/Psemu1/64030/estExt_Genemark1.C_480015
MEPYHPHFLFNGRLKNDLGEPVEGAQVQFWHADLYGNYFHPGDDLGGHEYMKDSFSYFGTATTDTDGNFEFKTYRPGIYVSRPVTHIHFKVFNEGQELLTSQFYFADENVQWLYDEMLILALEELIDDNGNVYHHSSKDVVVNMNKGGYQKLTPTQVEGPFYPVVDFFNVSSDMTLGMLEPFYDPTSSAPRTSIQEPITQDLEIDIIEGFVDYLEDQNVTTDGNYTWNYNDTDAEDVLTIDLIDGDDDDDNYFDELNVTYVGENFTSPRIEEMNSITSPPTNAPTPKPTEKENEENPSNNKEEGEKKQKDDSEEHKNPVDNEGDKKEGEKKQKDGSEEHKNPVDNEGESFVYRFMDKATSKLNSNAKEDSEHTSSDEKMRFLRSRNPMFLE